MYSAILSLAAAGGVWCGLFFGGICEWPGATGWAVPSWLVFFIATQRFAKKGVDKVQAALQTCMAEGQARMQAKVQRLQMRINSISAMKQAQAEIERGQAEIMKSALAIVDGLERYKGWIPLMGRQIASMRMQFHWALKDYGKVDELMPKAMLLDPMLRAVAMARMYMRGDTMEEIGKVYRAGAARLRYNQGVILPAAFSWMQLKKGDVDGAFKTLTAALEKSDNPILKANHLALQNGKTTTFSNQPFGEQWFALQLEEPKIKIQRQHQRFR